MRACVLVNKQNAMTAAGVDIVTENGREPIYRAGGMVITTDNCVCIGSRCAIHANDATVYGHHCIVYGNRCTIFGNHCTVYGDDATVYDPQAAVFGNNTVRKSPDDRWDAIWAHLSSMSSTSPAQIGVLPSPTELRESEENIRRAFGMGSGGPHQVVRTRPMRQRLSDLFCRDMRQAVPVPVPQRSCTSRKAEDGEDACLICFENVRDACIVPCAHSDFCVACIEKINNSRCPTCPACRTKIEGVIKKTNI